MSCIRTYLAYIGKEPLVPERTMVPDDIVQSFDNSKPICLAYIRPSGSGKSCHTSIMFSTPQLMSDPTLCLPLSKRQLECFQEGNKKGCVDIRQAVLAAPLAYKDGSVHDKMLRQVAAQSTNYRRCEEALAREIIQPLFNAQGPTTQVNSEAHILRLPSSTGRYQLLLPLGDAESLMGEFRVFVILWARDKATQQAECDDDDGMAEEDDADEDAFADGGDGSAGPALLPLSFQEQERMQRLRSRLQLLLAPGADVDQAAEQYLQLDKRRRAYKTFKLPWLPGLASWFNTSILAHGATQDVLSGMWQELESVLGLRQAVASLLVDGTAVLFEPQAKPADQMLPPRQLLSIMDTIGTGDPELTNQALTLAVQQRERHVLFFRNDNNLDEGFFTSPALRRVGEAAVMRSRGSNVHDLCSAAVLISTDKEGYNRELSALGLGKFATQGDLLLDEVQAAVAKAHSSSEARCKELLLAWLKRVRVKGKRLTPAEQDAALAALPVAGPFSLAHAVLLRKPEQLQGDAAAADSFLQATNFERFRWLHVRPLAMAAAAALEAGCQQLTDQLQDLGGSAADPAAAAQLQQLLSSEVRAWLEPLAQQQPLRKLSEKHVLRHVGLQYLKRGAAVVKGFLGAAPGWGYSSFEDMLARQIYKAAAAAALQLVQAIKEELSSSGAQHRSPDKLRQVLQQLLLPSNGFRVPDSVRVQLDAGFEFRYLIEQELERLGCVDMVYERLQTLRDGLTQLQQEALVGLQMTYAEHLDLFAVERNAAAARALQALQAAAEPSLPAAPAGSSAAAEPPVSAAPAGSSVAAAAAAAAGPCGSSNIATWPPWPAADWPTAALPELVDAAQLFCRVINSSSGFAAKAGRVCSMQLYGTSRASAKEQKDHLLQRVIMPYLEEAWAAAVPQGMHAMPLHIDLAGSTSSSTQPQLEQLQQQLQCAAQHIGWPLARIAAANLCKGLQQLPEWSKQLFPLPQEVEEVTMDELLDEKRPFQMPSKCERTSRQQQEQQQQQQQQQDQQQVPTSKPPRDRLIGQALHALGDSGSALLGLESRSAQQQRHLAWRRGCLQRELVETQQRLQRVQAVLDPTSGPALYPRRLG